MTAYYQTLFNYGVNNMLNNAQKETAKHLIDFACEWYFTSRFKENNLLDRYKNSPCFSHQITDELIKYVNKTLRKKLQIKGNCYES